MSIALLNKAYENFRDLFRIYHPFGEGAPAKPPVQRAMTSAYTNAKPLSERATEKKPPESIGFQKRLTMLSFSIRLRITQSDAKLEALDKEISKFKKTLVGKDNFPVVCRELENMKAVIRTHLVMKNLEKQYQSQDRSTAAWFL